ncbi:MAG TPA: DUF1028 domain-containing protein [Micromonosporaceae bacterium]|jgi:uncharacterized Ntn-hydrolase superfamily protein
MTFSIVARDPASGEFGVAVQSYFLGAGAAVPWARPGVGAVATQAFTEPSYGPRCLDLLAAGASSADALAEAVAADPTPFVRQVGVVGPTGQGAAHTGPGCIGHAGHACAEGFAVQANMMASPAVWPAMAQAYTSAEGPLARRLLSALNAAQAAGGDARGVKSAAILVVGAQPGDGRLIDVRVDYSDDPLGELARLLDAAEAYRQFNTAIESLWRGDARTARDRVEAGLALLPGDKNLRMIHAAALLAGGDVEGGRNELRTLLADQPSAEVVVRGFAATGTIPLPDGTNIDDLIG